MCEKNAGKKRARAAPAFPMSSWGSVPRVVASCYCWCQQRCLSQQLPFSLLAPPCDFGCPPQHMVGHSTVSPTTLCPNTTAGLVFSCGTCRCLLPSKCPELHRMRCPFPWDIRLHTSLCSMGDTSGPGVHSTDPHGSKNQPHVSGLWANTCFLCLLCSPLAHRGAGAQVPKPRLTHSHCFINQHPALCTRTEHTHGG